MNALAAQDIPTISADVPSLHDQYCLSRSCDEFNSSCSSRCNSSASPQGFEPNAGTMESPPTVLPAPHRFVRSAEHKNKFGFRGSKETNALNLSYLASYRQAQGRLRDDISPESSHAMACDRDEIYKLASEVAKLLFK